MLLAINGAQGFKTLAILMQTSSFIMALYAMVGEHSTVKYISLKLSANSTWGMEGSSPLQSLSNQILEVKRSSGLEAFGDSGDCGLGLEYGLDG